MSSETRRGLWSVAGGMLARALSHASTLVLMLFAARLLTPEAFGAFVLSTALVAFATKMRRWRHHCSSVFGPSAMVLPLWEALRPSWGEPRAVRTHQPVLAMAGPLPSGTPLDPQVRRARIALTNALF